MAKVRGRPKKVTMETVMSPGGLPYSAPRTESPVKVIKPVEPVVDRGSYYCACCGKEYKKQQTNFPVSKSPIFRGNNCYLPVCFLCVDDLYRQYFELLENEEEAIKRVCQKFDIYWNRDAYAWAQKALAATPAANTNIMRKYFSAVAMRPHNGKTYDNYLAERDDVVIKSSEDIKPDDASESSVSQDDIDRFGVGYTADEYSRMRSQYEKLRSQLSDDDDDTVQDELTVTLCTNKVLQDRMLIRGDMDAYDKFVKTYQATLKSAKWKPKNEIEKSSGNENDTWGTFIAQVEQFCPAEVYKDKHLFEDHDKIGEYFNRFIVRPFRNFFTGSSDMDPNYSVNGGDVDD